MANDICLTEENVSNVELVNDDSGLTLDDFERGRYLNTPKFGETIVFEVLKVHEKVPATQRLGKDGKSKYWDGLATRDPIKNPPFKQVISTDMGMFNVKNWEVYIKLFNASTGVLCEYAKRHNKHFEGAKLSIAKLFNDGHLTYNDSDLKTLMNFTKDEEVKEYKSKILKARTENKIFEVKLLN